MLLATLILIIATTAANAIEADVDPAFFDEVMDSNGKPNLNTLKEEAIRADILQLIKDTADDSGVSTERSGNFINGIQPR